MKAMPSCLIILALLFGVVFAEAEDPQMNVLKEHFPDGITDKEGKPVDLSTLKGKAVGIYFSAHWCGPCRAFTPSLVKFRDANAEKFEVVFVSSDKSPEKQKEYMEEAKMKWYTMTHRSEAANALAKKYQVRGIPALVLLKSNGDVLTTNGRSLVGAGVDAAQLAHPDVRLDVETEKYKCGRCDKWHTREKIKGLTIASSDGPESATSPAKAAL